MLLLTVLNQELA